MNKPTASENNRKNRGVFRTKIALALFEPKDPMACPSDEQLAGLAGNRLKGTERDQVLHHINGCDRCFQAWFNAATNSHTTQKSHKRRLQRLIGYGIAALTMTACLILLVVQHQTNNKNDTRLLVAQIYTQYLNSKPENLQESIDPNKLMLKSNAFSAYSLDSKPANSPSNLAFGAGIWEGCRRIAGQPRSNALPPLLSPLPHTADNQGDWSDTPYEAYYQLGQWCVVLKAAGVDAPAPKAGALWQAIGKAATQLKRTFETRREDEAHITVIVKGLTQILDTLNQEEEMPPSKEARRTIDEEVQRLIETLAPAVDER